MSAKVARETAEDAERRRVEELATSLARHGFEGCRVALVLGSGLGSFVERVEGLRAVPYGVLAGMPRSAVPGHAGRLVRGEVAGTRVLVQQGRVHLYEGWSAFEVARAARAFARIGVRSLVLTNAAGGLRSEWTPGTLMRVVDHLNLQGCTPLLRSERGYDVPYDRELGAALARAGDAVGVPLEHGVYAGVLGPAYETPAEVRRLRAAGADAVGMSTVVEACAARAAGMRVGAISCITNHAAGLSDTPPSHDEVLEVGRLAAERFGRVLSAAVPALAALVD